MLFTFIPVDIVPWYLTPAKFSNLLLSSKVKKVITFVISVGFRLPFLNSSGQIKNTISEQFVLGAVAYGLNNKYQGDNCLFNYSSDNPMVPTEIYLHRPDDTDD